MFKIVLFFCIALFLNANDCVVCHENETRKCEKSVHYTLEKAINITREAWGIANSHESLQTLAKPKNSIKNISDLANDFLRRKCLKCHVNNPPNNGCLSCHEPHQNKGKCQRQKPQMAKCLNCHNKNYVGGDYMGLFPKDHHKSYRAPITKDGRFPPQKHGIDYHHLSEDIHFQKGLTCIDCHKSEQMQGGKKASCTDCHKNLSKKNHKTYHKNISCSACHASWNNNSYELSVFRDDTADYEKWKDLSLQEDRYITNFLNKVLKSKKKLKPQMPDWVSREQKEGLWYSGFRYKRWEDFVLANADDGKIKIVRPLYQYRISYRDKNGTMVFDDVNEINGKKIEAWLPYSPHTIGKHAKNCEKCHENPLIINPQKTGYDVLDMKLPNHLIHAKPLTQEQIKKMQSKKYKKERAKTFFK